MILTVDIGNSRVKMAVWQSDEIITRAVVTYSVNNLPGNFDELFSELILSNKFPSNVFAVSVAQDEVSQSLNTWVRQHWHLNVGFLKTKKQYKNIINAYADPTQPGSDRWAGVVAGHQHFPGFSVCVVSAGTAITFDLVNKDGCHLGGYISPSYKTMLAALLTDTANVVAVSDVPDCKDDVPINTNDAVNQGLHKLIQAGVREFCQLAKDKMIAPVKIIITGGFAQTILDYPDMPAMHHKPDLVMQGLYEILQVAE